MIKFENTEVLGWEHAIRGMRNPMNSWEKSDSGYGCYFNDKAYYCKSCSIVGPTYDECNDLCEYILGPNDYELASKLTKAGTDHRKFMRMITVYIDITAPLYWWKEFDTYKVGTVVNSCSTMHKIAEKEFTLEDFSCEHLIDDINKCWDTNIEAGPLCCSTPLNILEDIVFALNRYRKKYLETKNKKYWWQMIQLLPSSYNQKRTVMLNYEVLANIYKSRKNHKLDEWVEFCKWIETLPYSELITEMKNYSDQK